MATRASRLALAGSNISSTGEVDADLLDNNDSAAFLSLNGSGFLGIGTASPQRHVVLYSPTASGQTNLQFQNSTTGTAAGDGFGVGMDANEKGFIWNYEGNDTYIGGTAAGTSMTIVGSSGNVGIGITNPAKLLHVQAIGSSGNGDIRVGADSGLDITHDNSGTTIQRIDSLYRTTNAAANLQLRTGFLTMHTGGSSIERMRIDADGNVGIGIDANVKLEVNGGADGSVAFGGRSDGGNGNNRRFNLIAYANGGGANYGGGLKIQTRSATNVFADAITVQSNTNVGIGTTAPLSRLHVHQSGTGNVPVTVASFRTESNAYGRGPRLDFSVFWGSDLKTAEIASPNVTGGAGYGGELRFSTNGPSANTMAERLRIDSYGKVGIGTETPDRLLDVSGTGNVYGKFQSTNSTGAGIEVKDTAEDWLIQADGSHGGLAFYDLGRSAYRMKIDANGYTIPDKLQPNIYQPVIDYAAITGTFNASGAAASTWHAITNVDFNNYGNNLGLGGRGHNFVIYWTSGNSARGYNHAVSGHVPYMGANAHIAYQGNSYLTSGMDSSHPHTGVINVSHHTAPVSGHDIRVRVHGNGTSYGPLNLQIWAEATPNAANAYISIWRV